VGGVGDRETGDADGEIEMFGVAGNDTQLGEGVGRGHVGRRDGIGTAPIAENFSDDFAKFAFPYRPCGGDDHALGGIIAAHKFQQGRPSEAGNRFLRPQDGAAQGMTIPKGVKENFADQIFGGVFHALDFRQDDAFLHLNVFGSQGRFGQQFAD
jgi:hypothetical protein